MMNKVKKIGCIFSLMICVLNISYSRILNLELASVYRSLPNAGMPLYIKASNDIDAYNDGRRIYITIGMLKFLKNRDEVALILAHEIAHRYTHNESRADILGAKLANKVGYNICIARENMLRFSKIENGEDGKHRSWLTRYHSLDKYCR